MKKNRIKVYMFCGLAPKFILLGELLDLIIPELDPARDIQVKLFGSIETDVVMFFHDIE